MKTLIISLLLLTSIKSFAISLDSLKNNSTITFERDLLIPALTDEKCYATDRLKDISSLDYCFMYDSSHFNRKIFSGYSFEVENVRVKGDQWVDTISYLLTLKSIETNSKLEIQLSHHYREYGRVGLSEFIEAISSFATIEMDEAIDF